jgi:acyl carrier protein
MRLEEIFASVLSEPISNITDFSSPKNLRSWNSIKHIQLVATLENMFDIKFTNAEIVSLNSFGDIKRILRQKGIEV